MFGDETPARARERMDEYQQSDYKEGSNFVWRWLMQRETDIDAFDFRCWG